MTEEDSLLEPWSKETGNAPNAKWRLQSFLLNQLQTDQSIAENAGQKRDLQDSADKLNLKTIPFSGIVFLYKIILMLY